MPNMRPCKWTPSPLNFPQLLNRDFLDVLSNLLNCRTCPSTFVAGSDGKSKSINITNEEPGLSIEKRWSGSWSSSVESIRQFPGYSSRKPLRTSCLGRLTSARSSSVSRSSRKSLPACVDQTPTKKPVRFPARKHTIETATTPTTSLVFMSRHQSEPVSQSLGASREIGTTSGQHGKNYRRIEPGTQVEDTEAPGGTGQRPKTAR